MTESLDFLFKHPDTGEVKIVTLQAWDIQQRLSDQLIDDLQCDCKPVGETNVIECNCDRYFNEFELQDRESLPLIVDPHGDYSHLEIGFKNASLEID
ncbi:hypothetical protein [Vibrio anguillarum]|uniref:Uncharacterized protein n=1 Tax=Vibrio anguillarum TaxID=55601 RepID=A0ABR9Z7T2_VIBAN|nr:hypothetical protein [Vibrio anguillarum]MBF4374507.1 hypothetical protein [Vibrio anguillarum]